MDINWIILLVVGISILFANKIDAATHSDGKLKKVVYVCGAGVLLIEWIPWIFAHMLA